MSSSSIYDRLFGKSVGKSNGLTGRASSREKSRHTLVVDAWDEETGKELFEGSEKIDRNLRSFNALEAQAITTDCYSACYEDFPELDEQFGDGPRSEFSKELLRDIDHEALREATRGNDFTSQVATVALTKSVAEYVMAAKKHEEDPDNNEAPDAKKAAKKASKEASDKVDEATEFADGFDLSQSNESTTPSAELLKAFEMMQKSDYLRNLAKSLGAFRKVAKSLQVRRFKRGHERVCGVKTGGELEHLLPSELSLLSAAPLMTLAKIVERRAMCRKMNAVKPAGEGPMIVLVDESGSMSGDNHIDAKAIAMTLAWIAMQQKRDAVLYGFSCGDDVSRLVLRGEDDKPLTDTIAWCEHFFGGGTDAECLSRNVPKDFDDLGLIEGDTDVVIITDGCLHLTDDHANRIEDFKREKKARIHLISIGCDPGPLADHCHYHHVAEELKGESVEHVLSIGAEDEDG